MGFYDVLQQWRSFDFNGFFTEVSATSVEAILAKENLAPLDFLTLLGDAAAPYREAIARRAFKITRRQFGNTIRLFTPLYISNYCENVCPYCSFGCRQTIDRRTLSLDEIESEARAIAQTGMRHVLVLTGEAPAKTPLRYLADVVDILREHFASIALEIFPLAGDGYKELIGHGVDGLTIYQEVYDEYLYKGYHRGGPKEDFVFRLDAPERALKENMRAVTIGPLLGLAQPVSEIFFAALHADYLWKKYPAAELSVSLPRLRPLVGEFKQPFYVNDTQFVRMLIALRLFLPAAGLTVSTRESADFRNNIVSLGVTKMSAGVSTAVGGHLDSSSVGQFEIADTRSVQEVNCDLLARGFQPVMHDWNSKLS
ncbi:MAG: 2-iminoacetate synthase ThiH [Chitinivibrionales bacterium]|nr:2-iminoacetate synthase ThiH [Chitinivibrionales bacterium]